jgi:hypothetical protein
MTCPGHCKDPGLWRECHCRAATHGLRPRSDDWCSCSCHWPVHEYIEGEWVHPGGGGDPGAVVTYAREPSPETGHVGWVWWAMGDMGESVSLEAAKAAAITSLERRGLIP